MPRAEGPPKPRCQSCGMPLVTEGFYGTNADGSENREYCKYCFEKGAYSLPDLDLEGMIARSVGFMTHELGFPAEEAETLSRKVIPGLKRWRS